MTNLDPPAVSTTRRHGTCAAVDSQRSGDGWLSDGPAGHRRGALRLLGGRARPRPRHRHPRRRAADGVLARADAGRHVPAVRARLAPRRRRRAHLRGVLRGPRAATRRTTTRSRSAVFLDYTEWFRDAEGARRRRAPGRRPGQARRRLRGDAWRTARRSPPRRCWRPRASAHFAQPARRGTTTCRADRRGAHQRAGLLRRPRRRPGGRSSAAGRAPTSGRRCCATTAPSGSTWCTATRRRTSPGQLGVRRPVRRADAGAPRLVARPPAEQQQAIAAGVLAGRPAHPRALAGAAAAPGRRDQPPGCEVVEVAAGERRRDADALRRRPR